MPFLLRALLPLGVLLLAFGRPLSVMSDATEAGPASDEIA